MSRFSAILLFIPVWAFSQSTNATLNDDYYHWIDRYEIKAGRVVTELFTTVKPYKRSAIIAFVDSLHQTADLYGSRQDYFNYEYIRNDSWEWSRAETSDSEKPVLKYFYKKKSDLAYVDTPAFDFHISPVLYLAGGLDSRLNDPSFINTRGVEMRGMIDRKVGFYTFFSENQAVLPSYVSDQISINPVIPHEGFWKAFKSNGIDFFQARGYIDFNLSQHLYVQFGHDRTFIGNGYRSLILSDFAPPNLFLRANLKVWKLNYLFQLNRVYADAYGSVGGSSGIPGKLGYPSKYVGFHHFSINVGKKLNLGLFESVVFGSTDSTNQQGFNFNYLNPVIFYRAIEQQGGSTDNVLLGMDAKWNVIKGVSLYGQLVLDEFLLSEVKARNGWWANKYALQGGLKYIDVAGVSNLDVQLETNVVRPFTYSHHTLSSYSSYRQPLAHPLGANFSEWIGIVRYQPLPRLNLTLKGFYIQAGKDTTGVNYGGDILKSNSTRTKQFNNEIGQGVNQTIRFVNLTASYQIRHNFFVDMKQVLRKSQSEVAFYNTNTAITSVALRWNIPQRLFDF